MLVPRQRGLCRRMTAGQESRNHNDHATISVAQGKTYGILTLRYLNSAARVAETEHENYNPTG